MLRSLYKNLWISSFVQCCYENYSAMQSNKRFNYSLVVPLLLLMWCVVLWRPGRDNWGIWVEYGTVVAAQLFFFSLIFVCATPEGSTVQRGDGFSRWPWSEACKDLAREEDISWCSGKSRLTRKNETSEPLKNYFQVWFNLSHLSITGLMWPRI